MCRSVVCQVSFIFVSDTKHLATDNFRNICEKKRDKGGREGERGRSTIRREG